VINLDKEKDISVIEIVTNTKQELLWAKPYYMKRMHGKGEKFIENYIEYTVVDSKCSDMVGGIRIVHHVVNENKKLNNLQGTLYSYDSTAVPSL